MHRSSTQSSRTNHTQKPSFITTSNIIRSVIFTQSWSFLSTTPRILAHAWILDYRKQLVIFPRGEPEHPSSPAESEVTLVDKGATHWGYQWGGIPSSGIPREFVGRMDGRRSGQRRGMRGSSWWGIGWCLVGRCEDVGMNVNIVFTNREREEARVDFGYVVVGSEVISSVELTRRYNTTCLVLRIITRYPFFYTQLLRWETPRHFLMSAHADHSYARFLRLVRTCIFANERVATRHQARSTPRVNTSERLPSHPPRLLHRATSGGDSARSSMVFYPSPQASDTANALAETPDDAHHRSRVSLRSSPDFYNT